MGYKFNPFTGTLDTVDSPNGVFQKLDVTGDVTLTLNGAASTPPLELTGTWFTGGTSTTTKPQVLIEPAGATSTAWSTSGTGFGVNAASGFAGRLLDLQLNGTSNFNVDSTGRVSFPLGAVGTPSLYPGADTNTGFWSPAADTLAASTNGTERARIDSSGRLGLGTSSPNYELHVNASDATNFIQLTNSGTGTGASDGLLVYNNGVNATVSNQEAGYLSFETTGLGRLHILSDGKVGIGTTSPSRQLDVRSTAFFDSNGDGTGSSPSIAIGSTSVGLSYVGGGHLSFTTGSAEKARIDSSGRLLVGTSSDSGGALLQVNGDRVRIATAKTPASASDTGTTGEICWDANYIYVCTATNTWKRSAISTW